MVRVMYAAVCNRSCFSVRQHRDSANLLHMFFSGTERGLLFKEELCSLLYFNVLGLKSE